MLKFFYFLMIFWLMIAPPAVAAKKASFVICAETGEIYHASNPDVITHPASLTKMMTLYLTFVALREGKLTFDKKMIVSKHAARQIPSKLWLKPGTMITVKQAILALVTKSANDAAVVLAETLAGSETHFAQIMTQKAHKLGMTKTVFKNSSGVPNKHQVTTARDMATLSRSLYKHFPEYFKFFKERKFVYNGQVHPNHNHLLGNVEGVDGIKTGFTCASGFNLAASMVRGGRRIIAIVLGGESIKARDKKMVGLLESTHASLIAKAPAHNKRGFGSISDLIYALGPSEAHADPLPQKKQMKENVCLSQPGKANMAKIKYTSMNTLIDLIDDSSSKKKSKKKNKKSFLKKINK